MKRLVAVILALATSVGVAEQASVPLSVELPDRPTAGARLFARKGCVRCHSLADQAGTIGPDLRRLVFAGTVLDLAGAFWNHAPVMRQKMEELKIPVPAITSEEMADIIALLTAYRSELVGAHESGDTSSGRDVFVAKGCADCHDQRAARWEGLGPSLQRYRGSFSAVFLAQALWNHGPEMASAMSGRGMAWPRFSGAEMRDLVAYLRTGGTGTAVEPVYFEPGSPRRGRDLFRDKSCIACHAIAGAGGQGGPDLGTRRREITGSVAAIAGLMWNHSQGMYAEFTRRGIPRVTFSGQEMTDVIAYLFFVNYANTRGVPVRGEQVFAARCASCHGLGVPGAVGPDLLAVPSLDGPIAIIAAMWNHAAGMETQVRKRNEAWPRFAAGEAADLTAFLMQRRTRRGREIVPTPTSIR